MTGLPVPLGQALLIPPVTCRQLLLWCSAGPNPLGEAQYRDRQTLLPSTWRTMAPSAKSNIVNSQVLLSTTIKYNDRSYQRTELYSLAAHLTSTQEVRSIQYNFAARINLPRCAACPDLTLL